MTLSRKLNLLVVDDSPTVVRMVGDVLQKQFSNELEVTALTDPTEVAPLLDNYCCDILLSDVEMPGRSGLEVVAAAKRRNVWTQAVIMTAHSTSERLATALDAGACDYLLKPVERMSLLEVVAACMRRAYRWQQALRGTLRPAAPDVCDTYEIFTPECQM
jgi:DNA-binding NtrC family response regulator